MKLTYILAAILSLAVQLTAQVAATAPQTTSQRGQPAVVPGSAMTNEDVVALLKTGLGTDIVVAKIKTSACDFNTSTPALQELKGNGVPDSVILAMVQAPKGMSRPAPSQPSDPSADQQTHPEHRDQLSAKGCMAVKPIGSHAFRNVMLFGAAGAFISHQQYQVVDVMDYPSHVGQKYHGNDLQTIQSSGTRVVLLEKHYTAEDLHKACH